jgi:hypothetical protein
MTLWRAVSTAVRTAPVTDDRTMSWNVSLAAGFPHWNSDCRVGEVGEKGKGTRGGQKAGDLRRLPRS